MIWFLCYLIDVPYFYGTIVYVVSLLVAVRYAWDYTNMIARKQRVAFRKQQEEQWAEAQARQVQLFIR